MRPRVGRGRGRAVWEGSVGGWQARPGGTAGLCDRGTRSFDAGVFAICRQLGADLHPAMCGLRLARCTRSLLASFQTACPTTHTRPPSHPRQPPTSSACSASGPSRLSTTLSRAATMPLLLAPEPRSSVREPEREPRVKLAAGLSPAHSSPKIWGGGGGGGREELVEGVAALDRRQEGRGDAHIAGKRQYSMRTRLVPLSCLLLPAPHLECRRRHRLHHLRGQLASSCRQVEARHAGAHLGLGAVQGGAEVEALGAKACAYAGQGRAGQGRAGQGVNGRS